jgi:L-aspartate oxidase
MAMAFEAGAVLSDLEFVQFHPTVLSAPETPRFLLSEAMRGEGGRLRNENGETFMQRYDARAELAPRDVVSRSIVEEMKRTGGRRVFLDLTHLDSKFLRERFPKIYDTCLRYGFDITRDLLPVSPAAHYVMGGVRTDIEGRTSLPGLYAAGEVACTGVHGANRLASNSLLEGLVFGARAAKAALADLADGVMSGNGDLERRETSPADWMIDARTRRLVQELMWLRVGLIRQQSDLSAAVTELTRLAHDAPNPRSRNFANLARLIAEAALWREESRGGHFRSDFPERLDDRWRVHSMQEKGKPLTTSPTIV